MTAERILTAEEIEAIDTKQAKPLMIKLKQDVEYYKDIIRSQRAKGINYLSPNELAEYRHINIPTSEEDYNNLKKDIKENGIRQPLQVWKRIVLAGNTRLKIAQELKLDTVPCLFLPENMTVLDQKEYAISDNLNRRQLTIPQKVELALQLSEILTERAKERKAETGKNNLKNFKDSLESGSSIFQNDEKAEKEEKGEALKIAAKMAGVGYEAVYKGKTIKTENPELYGEVQAGEKSINEAYKIVKPRPISTDQMIRQAQKQIDRANYKNAPKDLPKFKLSDTQIFFALTFKSTDTLIEQLKYGAVNEAGKEYLSKAIEAMSEKIDMLASSLTYPYKQEAKPVEEAWQCKDCMIQAAGRKLCEVVKPCPKAEEVAA